MYGLGANHPNSRRTSSNNPNYQLSPWLNPSVLRKSHLVSLWEHRTLLYGVWLDLGKPHWYAFGKHAVKILDSGSSYTPHNFEKMVAWFVKGCP